jgi:hypothetical protein
LPCLPAAHQPVRPRSAGQVIRGPRLRASTTRQLAAGSTQQQPWRAWRPGPLPLQRPTPCHSGTPGSGEGHRCSWCPHCRMVFRGQHRTVVSEKDPLTAAQYWNIGRRSALRNEPTVLDRFGPVSLNVAMARNAHSERVRCGVRVIAAASAHASRSAVVELHSAPLPAPLTPITRTGMDEIPDGLGESGHSITSSNSDGASISASSAVRLSTAVRQ